MALADRVVPDGTTKGKRGGATPGGGRPARSRPTSIRGGDHAKRADNATQALGLVSTGATLVGLVMGHQVLMDDAGAVALHAEPIAQAVADTAETNDYLAALLDHLEMINGIGAIVLAGMPLILQIMVNHRAKTEEGRERIAEIAPSLAELGVLEPGLMRKKLQAQHKAKMARLEEEQLRAQHDAERDLRQARADIADLAEAGDYEDITAGSA